MRALPSKPVFADIEFTFVRTGKTVNDEIITRAMFDTWFDACIIPMVQTQSADELLKEIVQFAFNPELQNSNEFQQLKIKAREYLEKKDA